jgi:cytochrome c-type biogenesis protein CcmF
VGGAGLVLAVVAGVRGISPVVAIGLASFAFAAIVRQFAVGVRARMRSNAERPPRALVRMVRANPRLYGGLVVHVGVVLVALVLACSSTAGVKREVRLVKGQSVTVSGYRLTYIGASSSRSAQRSTVSARVRISHGGRDLGTYAPAVSSYPNAMTGIGTPSVRTGLVEDVYLTIVSLPNARGRVTIAVLVNPMVLWLWIGGGVMALGTLIALVPGGRPGRRRAVLADDATPEVAGTPVEVPV